MHFQVGHRLGINLHHASLVGRVLQQVLREHPHARPYFEHFFHLIGQLQRAHDVAGNIRIGQKMLAQMLFGANGIHGRE